MDEKLNILVIEQKEELFEYLVNFLPLLGPYEVHRARFLIEALAKINALKPVLVVYNLSLEQAHARAFFLEEVAGKHKTTRVFALVGAAAEESELKRIGVKDILVKPYDLTELSDKIRDLLPVQKGGVQGTSYARLLIADEEPEISGYLEEVFLAHGIEVHRAADSQSALALFREKQCNLAIIGLNLARIEGLDLIRMLEKSTTPPSPRDIVAVTAALGGSLEEVRRRGFPVFEKPLNMSLLEEHILRDCRRYNLSLHSASS